MKSTAVDRVELVDRLGRCGSVTDKKLDLVIHSDERIQSSLDTVMASMK